jgi:hypothetical protein
MQVILFGAGALSELFADKKETPNVWNVPESVLEVTVYEYKNPLTVNDIIEPTEIESKNASTLMEFMSVSEMKKLLTVVPIIPKLT